MIASLYLFLSTLSFICSEQLHLFIFFMSDFFNSLLYLILCKKELCCRKYRITLIVLNGTLAVCIKRPY